MSKKRINSGEIARGNFSKITETARLPGTELGTDNSQYGGYITRLWNLINSYWMFSIGGLSWRFSGSHFSEHWKITFCDFIAFFSFLAKATFWFFQMCFTKRTIAYLCLNMINFDVVDFSERRSEEVISFFWRSVYLVLQCTAMNVIILSNILSEYSQLCLSRSRISRISPKSKVYTRHLSFIFYCFLPHRSKIFSRSKLFLQSQEIRLRQSWL